MRRLIAILALLFAAAWIAPANPAAAAYLPPGGLINHSWGGCTVQVTYGTFGNAFGDATPLGSSCGGAASVRIFAAYHGTVTAHTCTLETAVFHPGEDPNCRLLLPTATLRSTVISDPGGAFRVDTTVCGGGSCRTFSDGLFG